MTASAFKGKSASLAWINEGGAFFFNDTATTEIYTLSLHDALPISTVNWGISGHTADAATVTQPGGAGTGYTVTAARPVFSEEVVNQNVVVTIKDGSADA